MTSSTAAPKLSRGRRWLVRAIMAVATVLVVAAIFAVWANRQVLDADNWATTSSELLENREIRTQISTFLVDQVYERVDVSGEVAAVLPPRLDPLAGPAANGLRDLAEKRTFRLLSRPKVQDAWEAANRVTAQQFVAIAEGDSRAITINGNAVVLNVRVLVADLVKQLGGSGKLIGKVPPDAGRITVMTSDEVSTLQNAVSAVKGLSAVLPGVAIALFALAVFLSPGRRRRVLMWAGGGFIIAGAIVLVGRNLAGDYVVGALADTAAVEPAVEAVWSIGSQMLRDVAQAAVIMGIPVVIAAWLAGPMRPAVALRRAAAPWLRTRPDIAYGVLAAGILLVLAWGPIPATRMVLPVLLMIALAVAGMEVLRRQVAEEFPTATAGDVRASMRAGVTRVTHAFSAAPEGGGNGAPKVEPRAAAPPPQPTRIDQLERLTTLHDSGALTDEEFAAEKRRLSPPQPVR